MNYENSNALTDVDNDEQQHQGGVGDSRKYAILPFLFQ